MSNTKADSTIGKKDMSFLGNMKANSMIGKKDMSGLGDAAGGIMNVLPFGKSTAKTDSEVAVQSAQGIMNGAMTGMKIGGPVGALVGAGIGAIGKGGSIKSPESYTEYGDYSLSTGIRGLIGNSGLKKRINNMKRSIDQNKIALKTDEDLQAHYDEEQADLTAMKYGGKIGGNALLDDGELYMTPDGAVSKIPEQGNPTDSNLMNLPQGTKILSDSINVPGTSKTFAEFGEEMMNKKKIKGNDKYAQGTQKAVDLQNKNLHGKLFELQEQLKNTIGMNNSTNKYKDGGVVDGIYSLGEAMPMFMDMFAKPERYSSIQNPYEGAALAKLKNRTYDIQPALDRIQQDAIADNYNFAQLNTNTGANMAYKAAAASRRNKSIGEMYSQKSNIDNQYAAEYANALGQYGAQRAAIDAQTRDLNMRSSAAASGIRRQALNDLSNFSQNKTLRKNQKERDSQWMNAWKETVGKDAFSTQALNSLATGFGFAGVSPTRQTQGGQQMNFMSGYYIPDFSKYSIPKYLTR